MSAKKPTQAQKDALIGVQPYTRTATEKRPPTDKSLPRPGNGLSATGNLADSTYRRGGRKPGAKNKTKQETSQAMLNDLIWCYEKLGGKNWLFNYAKNNPGDFIKQGLSRLFPVPYQEPADAAPAPTIYNNLTLLGRNDPNALRDAALQIAFALRVAVEDDPSRTVSNFPSAPARIIEPVKEPPPPYVPEAAAPIDVCTDSLQDQAQAAAAHELIRNTVEKDLVTYSGSGSEQGDFRKKKPASGA